MAEISKIAVVLRLNGHEVRHEIEPRMLPVEFIREQTGLTGTHVGRDTSYCGACTVLLNGRSVKSCTVLAAKCRLEMCREDMSGGEAETVTDA
jgi:aerobic-type carbon monoxide dehydrogenase small subunit (CoxS/CutS family)